MAKHRTHSIEFKRQVAQDYVAEETLHSLAKHHDLSRNLIRIWVQKYETAAFDEDAAAADMIETYEARIAALERLVGKQALESEFLKGALRHAPRTRSAPTSVITGPVRSPSSKDASWWGSRVQPITIIPCSRSTTRPSSRQWARSPIPSRLTATGGCKQRMRQLGILVNHK